ncbi:unnamed protein product [Rotaria sp. Silwood1]|nr:unnamed protein product [Rotaria sp. Silwood1]CAF1331374.1 unnamed protein product [Rotaria sp. Silwood1]CAF1332464.1 unnamed protein product [Rotaria sp. Silwood1]CAF3543523.1 unnamed protein product [Rotaria sp. Silwood1]CAF3571169.1 unnamed protein product [Rotaria sp. Silwood1]
MKANLFCLIFLIFCNEIHRLIALECYSCLSIKSNTTGCHDKFYYNETLISTTDLRNSDAICTKMIGKLADGTKFTFRNASSIGCPKDLENFIIVGNDNHLRISRLEIYCCNKKLCNRTTGTYYIQSNMLILIVLIINSMCHFHEFFV